MSDEPKFYKRNFINAASALVVSTGPATIRRIHDRDNELKWQSIGSDDVTDETITVTFLSAGLAFPRDIDFLAVLGHNLDTFRFQHDIGAGFVNTPLATTTGETESFTIFPIAKLTGVLAIRLIMNTTQVVDAQKQVGEALALESLFLPPDGEAMSRFGFNNTPVAKVTAMFDGGTKVNLLRWAGNRTERYSARLGFDLSLKASYDALRVVLKQASFVLQPEPEQRPDEFFQVTAVPGGHPSSYTSKFKGAGYSHSITVRED